MTHRRLGQRIAAVLVLGLALAPPPARADEPPAEVARELSRRAHEAYRAGHNQEALDLLGAAYRLDPRPVLLYNMGRVLEATDRAAALREYRRCLEQPGCPDAAAERARVLEQQVDAGQPAEPSATPSAPAPPPGPPPAPATSSTARRPSPWPWVLVGVGVGGVAAGVVTGLVGSARHEDAIDERSVGRSRDLQQQAERLATWTNVALVAGGTLLVAGGVWAAIDLSTARPGVTLGGRF